MPHSTVDEKAEDGHMIGHMISMAGYSKNT